jgi:hypothetical protein
MNNKKIIVKRRNNIAKSNNNAVGNLLKALKKPMQMPKRNKPSRGFKSLKQESGFSENLRMEAPVAFGSMTKVSKPNLGRARTIVKHSEYIADINGSAAFTIQQTIFGNPGLLASFPWLSQIASAYEKYRILKIRYRFETEAPTTYTGSIFLSPEFNPQDAAPLNKLQTFQNEDTVRTVPWRGICCVIPAKYLKVYNDYFVRSAALAVNQDLKTYDPFVLYVCSQGQANGNLAGEIWVDYEIELLNPIGNAAGGSLLGFDALGVTSAGLTNTHIFTGLVNYSSSIIGITPTTNVMTLYPLTIGNEYLVFMQCSGNGSSAIPTVNSGGTAITANFEGAGTPLLVYLTFTATAITAVITWVCIGTNWTQTIVTVSPIPSGSGF